MKPQLITPKAVAVKLIEIFPNHIGRDKAIDKRELYKKVFGAPYKSGDLLSFYNGHMLRNGLHYLRVFSTCFPVPVIEDGEAKYFVISTKSEAELYVKLLDRNMARMKLMQNKARRYVDGGYFKRKFEFKRI